MKKRVLVAMSGGVDSSVTAALLKDKDFEVIGITMQMLECSYDWGGCCGIEAIEDARRVANKLGIPHFVLNLKGIFKEKVIDNFCGEYKKGRTPNPCIRCNQYIKFDTLFKKAKELNTDFIATGHYARVEYDKPRKRFLLKKGIDSQKDQSYVLYIMTQEQLRLTLMPLGELTKNEVRQIAQELDLPVANKLESQEICFVPDSNYGEFLKGYIPESIAPGSIIDKEDNVIGRHQGIIFYTVGQRKGLNIANRDPLYVIKVNKKNNTIVAGYKKDVYSNELIATDMNYMSKEELKEPIKVEVKIRYRHSPSLATAVPLGKGKVCVKFNQPQWAVTPGQSVVFYLSTPSDSRQAAGTRQNNKDRVFGGGVILSNNN